MPLNFFCNFFVNFLVEFYITFFASGITGYIVGVMSDYAKSKLGRHRRFLLYGLIPYIIGNCLFIGNAISFYYLTSPTASWETSDYDTESNMKLLQNTFDDENNNQSESIISINFKGSALTLFFLFLGQLLWCIGKSMMIVPYKAFLMDYVETERQNRMYLVKTMMSGLGMIVLNCVIN